MFVREIETALVERRIELAVHSFKDLPTTSPAELVIGAVPKRFDPADLLLVRTDKLAGTATDWLPLGAGARVGTASARRRVWLAHFRPDLTIQPLRGNVPTRIRKLRDGQFDAIVLAAAGVEVACETARRSTARSTESRCCGSTRSASCRRPRRARSPCNAGSTTRACARYSRALDHRASHAAVDAERDALRRAEGGCDIAFGAYFVHGDTATPAAPGVRSTSCSACTSAPAACARRACAARIPRKLGADLWAKLDGERGDAR